jgi:hypothetical protein
MLRYRREEYKNGMLTLKEENGAVFEYYYNEDGTGRRVNNGIEEHFKIETAQAKGMTQFRLISSVDGARELDEFVIFDDGSAY